jgi:hypothetical protein
MRPALLALLLFFSSISALSHPPHAEVWAHNNAIADSLLNSGCSNETIPTYDNPAKCAEMELLTAYPSVDARVSAASPPRLLWRYAYSATSQNRTVTNSEGCTTVFRRTFQSADAYADITSLFRGFSYSLSNVTWSPVQVPIPREILNMSEGDNLTLLLEGRITLHYIQDSAVCSCVNGSCTIIYSSYPYNITYRFQRNLTYLVEAGEPLHFLSKPVLREQWAGDSQFEDLVFSGRKFYLSSLSLDGNEIANGTFYEFNMTNDSYGAWGISSHPFSNLSGMSETEREQRVQPIPLEHSNTTFPFLYEFSSKYDFTGPHIISLNLSDEFGNNFSQSFNITNRMLTLSNSKAENGSTDISNSSIYRPSSSPISEQFSLLLVGGGSLGALALLLALLRELRK